MKLRDGIVWQRDGKGPGYLFAKTTGALFGLNTTAAALLGAIAGGSDAPALVARLTCAFEVDEETARADVEGFLSVLREHDLLDA